MAVVSFKKSRPRRSIRYYLLTHEGLVRIPLWLFEEMIAGKVAAPQFANSLQRTIEVLIQAGPQNKAGIRIRGTSTRFDAEGKVDLGHAVEAVSAFLAGSAPTKLSDNVVDISSTIRWRRSEREGRWRPSAPLISSIRADVEGHTKLPVLSISDVSA